MNTQQREYLRDKYAIAALPALIAKDAASASFELLNDGAPCATAIACDGERALVMAPQEEVYDMPESWEDVANAAYAIAEAMLIARERRGE